MGAANSNPLAITAKGAGRFDTTYQAEVDADRGLHHAIAFEQVTGWPVHAAFAGDKVVRYYNEDATSWAFDVRGMMPVRTHFERVLTPIVQALPRPADWRSRPGIELGTKCLGSDAAQRDEAIDVGTIDVAERRIRENRGYLAVVPIRPWPRYPGEIVSRYAFRHCMVFAEALAEIRGLPAATMLAESIHADVHVDQDQRQHAIVEHPDGDFEDVWGKAPAAHVAQRYGFTGWRLCRDTHRTIIDESIAREPRLADEIAQARTVILTQAAQQE